MTVIFKKQLALFQKPKGCTSIPQSTKLKISRSGAFTDNMKLPIHRWFRYSAGFSAEWVEQVIAKFNDTKEFYILDPFAGSGTTLLASEASNVKAIGFESHSFVYRIANAKLNWDINIKELGSIYLQVLKFANENLKLSERANIPLLGKCYTNENLSKLDALKNAYLLLSQANHPLWELIWLCITSILRSCSTAGTAQWQYVLPNKKKSNVLDPFVAFRIKMNQIMSDIMYAKDNNWKKTASINLTDARNPTVNVDKKFDLVITSPPYPNNYDYADSSRLEMTFWGDISGWKDLHSAIRQYLIRSCSQHSAAERLVLDDLLQDKILAPIRDELSNACRELAKIRLSKGGKKTYHTMAAAYFQDLGVIFHTLRHLCKEGSTLCFVVGDSAPYGVYLSVDEWLGKLAISAGFKSYHFEKLRDRNIKWKNRKHNVPLHEGRLWIQG